MSENQASTFGNFPHIKKTLLTALTNSAMMMNINEDLEWVTSIETAGSQSKHKAPQFGLLAQIVMMMMTMVMVMMIVVVMMMIMLVAVVMMMMMMMK